MRPKSIRSTIALVAAACLLLAFPVSTTGATSIDRAVTAEDEGGDSSAGGGDESSRLSPAAWLPGLVLGAGWVVLVVLQLRRGRHIRRASAARRDKRAELS